GVPRQDVRTLLYGIEVDEVGDVHLEFADDVVERDEVVAAQIELIPAGEGRPFAEDQPGPVGQRARARPFAQRNHGRLRGPPPSVSAIRTSWQGDVAFVLSSRRCTVFPELLACPSPRRARPWATSISSSGSAGTSTACGRRSWKSAAKTT